MKTVMKTGAVLAALVVAGAAWAAGPASPAGDPVRGKRLFVQCVACHAISATAPA